MSFLRPHGEVSVGLGAWGEEALSGGELVCPGEGEASSAAGSGRGAGHAGPEVGGDDRVPWDGDRVVEEAGKWLDFEALQREFDGTSGSFPQRSFCAL